MATNNLATRVTEQVQGSLLSWLNTNCSLLPTTITFEDLPDDDYGICISTQQTAYYVARYIAGGYKAQYQFSIIYRVLPMSQTERLNAVNLLNQIADWCEENYSTLTVVGTTKAQKITKDSNASVLSVYEDGTKDYDISLTLTWEVI